MTRVLVPLAVLEGESVPPGLIELLGTADVTALGYHELPEQTPPDQARLQYGDRATAALEDVTAEFREAGGAADHRLVFTHDRDQTLRRVAAEAGVDAYAIAGATGPVERLLVSLNGEVAVEAVLDFVVEVVGGRDIDLTLLLATDDEVTGGGDGGPGEEPGRTAAGDRTTLDDAAERLREAGLTVETELAAGTDPFDALVDAATGHDAVVMGERAPSLRSFLFGGEADRVATETVGPVLVVRREDDGADAES